jgi:hypothetical protein
MEVRMKQNVIIVTEPTGKKFVLINDLRFKGKTKEEFQRNEKIWAVASIVIGLVFIVFATYYNLNIRTPLTM